MRNPMIAAENRHPLIKSLCRDQYPAEVKWDAVLVFFSPIEEGVVSHGHPHFRLCAIVRNRS